MNGVLMAIELSETVLAGILQGIITLGLAAMGSLILWRFYGKRIVAKAVTRHGSDALWDALEDMSKDPRHPNHQRLARFMGTQFAWLMESVAIDMETEEGRQKYAPIFKIGWDFIQASIYGAIGNFIKKAQEDGMEMGSIGSMADMAIPDSVKGLANHLMPKRMREAGLELPDLIEAGQFISRFLGRGNGGTGSPSQSPAQGHAGGPYQWGKL